MKGWLVGVLLLGLWDVAYAEKVPTPSVSPVQYEAKDVTKVANANLAVMRDTIKSSRVEKSLFGSFFGGSVSALDADMLRDLDHYLIVYGEKPLSVEAIQLKAILHNRHDDNEALAMDYLYILSAYAGSRYERTSRKGLKDLLADPLKYDEGVITTQMSVDFSSMAEQSDRLFSMLSGISAIDNEKFNRVIVDACALFLTRYPDYDKADKVQNILAAHEGKDYDVAVYEYEKLITVYPGSSLQPDALFAIADVQRTGLKSYEKAAQNYRKVIEQFPLQDITKRAYINLALTESVHLKDYQAALTTLNTAVEKYADDAVTKEALQMLGEIYSKKTKEYAKSVQSYRKLSDIFLGDDGIAALKKAESIATSSMHDYPLVIAIDEQLIRDYPSHELAPEALMNIAEIYEKKLKQKMEAIKAYQRVIEQYPNSKQAKKASSNIRKLEKDS